MTTPDQDPSATPPSADAHVRIVRCPVCAGDSVYAPSNPYRPFCSARCRQIDFGDWASESFRVPSAPPDPDGASNG